MAEINTSKEKAVAVQDERPAGGTGSFELGRNGGLTEDIDPHAIGGTLDDMPRGYYLSASFIGTVVAVGIANMCCYLGFVLPANLLSIINEDLGPSPTYVWISLVWTLCISITYTLLGRLSDIFGRRWFFIGGNVVGLVGTIIAGTAKNINTIIGGTSLIGIAAAVQLSFGFIVGELVPNKYRSYANGALFATALPFSTFGPVIARAFILHTSAGWRWCYYLNTILCGVTCILFFFFYHPPTFHMLHTKASKSSWWHMFDFGGFALFVIGLVVFLLGISWGGQQYPWKSGQVIGTIVGGGCILILFVFYEIFMPISFPLIPMRLFMNRGYISIIMTASVGAMLYYSLNVLWPTQVTALYGTGLLQIGWLSCAVGGGTLLGNIIGGLCCENLGHQKWQLVVAACMMTGFIGGLSASTADTIHMSTALVTLGSMAVGFMECSAFTTAPLCLEPEDIGLASGVLGSVRSALSTIATSIYVTILTNELGKNIPKYVVPAAIEAGLPESSVKDLIAGFTSGTFASVIDVTPDIIAKATVAYKEAYSKSFYVVYLATIAFGACAIVAALCSPNVESKFSMAVARRLHGKDIEKKEAQFNAEHKVATESYVALTTHASLSKEVNEWLAGIRYIFHGPKIIAQSYIRGIPYAIRTPSNYHVLVSSPAHMDELSKAPEAQLGLRAIAVEMFTPKLTMYGLKVDDHHTEHSSMQSPVLRKVLTSKIPELQPALESIVRRKFEEICGGKEEGGVGHGWTSVPTFSMVRELIGKANSHMFFGLELSNHGVFLEAAMQYPQDVAVAGTVLQFIPTVFQPIITALLTRRGQACKTLVAHLTPVIEERLRFRAAGAEPEAGSMDCIQWIIDTSPRHKAMPPATKIIREALAMWFGSNHQLIMTLVFAMYDLCLHPECVEALRKEIEDRSHNDDDDDDGCTLDYDNLPLLDSFCRESARLHPSDSISVRRKANTVYTFSDGLHIPVGNWVCVPQMALMRDPVNYPSPEVFDGSRFVENNGMENEKEGGGGGGGGPRPKFTDTGVGFPFWGLGKRAW
ncbi:MAG: hypothetical protein M1827_004451 [Pycnora praestabilis]|nr:MAG: hypothetical protein M1827_004451 [Pycnora praestabilis]